MAFTYEADLSTAISRVRQLLGDTVSASALVQDETITYYLDTRSELATALQLARDLMARFATEVDKDIDGQGQRSSQRYANFKSLVAQLSAQVAAEAGPGAATDGTEFSGIEVFGATAQEVIDAREDCNAAANAPLRWGW